MNTETESQQQQIAAQRMSSEWLARMIDANPVASFVIDHLHRVVLWNKGCEVLLEHSASEMLGTSNHWLPFYEKRRNTLADLLLDHTSEDIIEGQYNNQGVHASLTIPGAYEAEGFFPKLGNSGRWLHFTAAPVFGADGEVMGVMETLVDVTQERQAKAALKALNDSLEEEIVKRTAELAKSNQLLAESGRVKSQFLTAISRELKTPLNGMIGLAKLISLDPKDDMVAEYAEGIQSEGTVLHHLLSNLLALSEIGAGLAKLTNGIFQVEELIAQAVRRHQLKADEKGLRVCLKSQENLPEVMFADGNRMLCAIECILENAIKFTHQGEIHIHLKGSAELVEVEIQDSGPGIKEAEQKSIFDKFTQLERFSTPEPGGIGLGLALARAQMRMMGGEVKVDSEEGKGARFTLLIPRHA